MVTQMENGRWDMGGGMWEMRCKRWKYLKGFIENNSVGYQYAIM